MNPQKNALVALSANLSEKVFLGENISGTPMSSNRNVHSSSNDGFNFYLPTWMVEDPSSGVRTRKY